LQTFEEAKSLAELLDRRQTLIRKLTQSSEPKLEIVARHLRNMQGDDLLLISLLQSCDDIQQLAVRWHYLLTKAINVPQAAELNLDFKEAVARLADGKSAFVLPFVKADARKLLAAVTIVGSAPKSAEDWKLVRELLRWRADARKCVARWNSVASAFGVEPQTGGVETALKTLVRLQGRIRDMHDLIFKFDRNLHIKIDRVFGKLTSSSLRDGDEAFILTLKASLETHLEKGRLAYAMNRVGELVRKLQNHNGEIVAGLRAFLTESLGQSSSDESLLHKSWLTLQAELSHLSNLRPALDDIGRASDLIESAGAPKWAGRLRTQPTEDEIDRLTPPSWREAWNWRRAVMFLERIDGHQKLRELSAQRSTLTTALARTYQDLVAEKTWLGVFQNSPEHTRQALQAYLNAIQAMGSGTGVRANRHRKTAREAMTRAYLAVPCWILPEWRISETIPSEVGAFDLVVIDEASQSDISAFPALLRGTTLLVVGDHKQVSPSAIGVKEVKIKELSDRFLVNQPHASEMTPGKSIYDLARVVFAGNSVMLKEHFRCVPAIIEYSNREFYSGDIVPPRLPHPNERLDPPLIDVFVRGGFRKGDVNDPEAKAIVNEIQVILADKNFAGRSIGVVTLLGSAQASRIQELVSDLISPVDVVARKITVGQPQVFQGKERDIMLVSMVLGPGDRSLPNRADLHQRFNVALSRARDRMYLFRSVKQEAFAEDTLNGKLISHFKNPFRQDVRNTKVLRERCESGFELDMFDELVARGFRVEPQVKCGAYRIDFVVLGREGRRLAVECDGDRFHGPGHWSDDMVRQRVLERAGWTFWRCFASSFTLRRGDVLKDLLQTLDSLGIEPLGAESVDNTVWVHSREVDPYGVVDGEPPRPAEETADSQTAKEEEQQSPDREEPTDEEVRRAIYLAVPLSGRVDEATLIRSATQNLGFQKTHVTLKRQIMRILGREAGSGRLERNADWDIWRSNS
jgi:very-short-patch-repair endonuclease